MSVPNAEDVHVNMVKGSYFTHPNSDRKYFIDDIITFHFTCNLHDHMTMWVVGGII